MLACTHRLAVNGMHAILQRRFEGIVGAKDDEAEPPGLARLPAVQHLRRLHPTKLFKVASQCGCRVRSQ